MKDRKGNAHRPQILVIPRLPDQPLDLLLNADLLRAQGLRVGRDLKSEELVGNRLKRFERLRLGLVRLVSALLLRKGGVRQATVR